MTAEIRPVHGTNKEFHQRKWPLLQVLPTKETYKANCKVTVTCIHPHIYRTRLCLHLWKLTREGENSNQAVNVISKCANICNTRGNTSKSCAKILLVKVYSQGKNSSKDEQSNFWQSHSSLTPLENVEVRWSMSCSLAITDSTQLYTELLDIL